MSFLVLVRLGVLLFLCILISVWLLLVYVLCKEGYDCVDFKVGFLFLIFWCIIFSLNNLVVVVGFLMEKFGDISFCCEKKIYFIFKNIRLKSVYF